MRGMSCEEIEQAKREWAKKRYNLNIRTDSETLETLKFTAKKLNRSASDVARKAIKEYCQTRLRHSLDK